MIFEKINKIQTEEKLYLDFLFFEYYFISYKKTAVKETLV